MNIVVVAPRFPFPLDKGDRLTVFHLLKYFSQRHQVSLICFLEADQDPAWVEKVAPFCARVEVIPLRKLRAYGNCAFGLLSRTPLQIQYYADPNVARAVRSVIDEMKPDLLYAHTIRMGQYIEPYRTYPRVLAMQISMTLNYRRLAERASSWPSKFMFGTEYRKVRAFEAEFARQFDRVLLISKHDLAAIDQATPLDNVFFSPHGVDFTYFAPDPAVQKEPNSLIFTGNMNYAPNVDAALYFYSEIFPFVREQLPVAKLKIVGADPAPEILALKQDAAVQVTGRVPDLRVYMKQACVAIDPLRVGAGLQNKVLEGMSMGLPMVITSIANEGIQAVDQENVFIADSPRAFADCVVTLLTDPRQRQMLGAAARAFILQNWSWEKHFADLEALFHDLVNAKHH
ncbi:MAG: hypothetical protein DCC55_08375 [Chloroflexi bacterium]|nr:MAG: hypothetical protein DCC55_08375 [Chloroflexota bacterium]